MLRLKELVIKNAGRFSGTHKIQLENRSLVIQIDALNKNTGGSSGSGKSTIFNALEYNLGINSIPSTVLQSRLTKDPLEVIGIYDHNGEEVAVRRSKSLLEITSPSKTVTGNVDQAEQYLDQMIGVPRKLLRNLIHKRQKEGGFFVNMTPKECHTFLAECTDLNPWIEKGKKAEKQLSEINQQVINAKHPIDLYERELETLTSSLAQVKEPDLPNVVPEALDTLRNIVAQERQKEADAINRLEIALSEIQDPERPAIESLDVSKETNELLALKSQLDIEMSNHDKLITQKRSDLDSINKKLISMSFLSRDKALIQSQIDSYKKEISKIKDNICPTCNQHWNTDGHKSHLEKILADAKSGMIKISQIDAELATEPSLVQEKNRIDSEIVALRSVDFKELKTAISNAEFALNAKREVYSKQKELLNEAYTQSLRSVTATREKIRLERSVEIQHIQQTISAIELKLAEKQAVLKAYATAKESYDRTVNEITKKIDSVKIALEKQKQIYSQILKKQTVIENSIKLMRSFVNQTFQSALDTIALRANEMLSKVPNTSTMTVTFEGFKETKSGTVKEEVTAILNMDGELNVPLKSISGGESTMVNLAIDLATIELVEQRAGKGMDIFVLDEPFDGLDSVCREQCLELLRNSSSGKRILIVDHSNETKELVSDRIYVVREGQNSTLCDNIL